MAGITDLFLTPQNVERGVNLLQSNRGIIDALAHNLAFLPSSGRTFVKSLAGSTTPIDESYFSESQLAEIKNRTAKQMAERSMKYRPDYVDEDDPSRNLFYNSWGDVNRVVPYDSSSPISMSGIFTDPKVDIDATLGTYVYKENPDGTVSAIDKHDFSSLEGGMEHLYGAGEGADLGQGTRVNVEKLGSPQYKGEQGLPFLPPVDMYGDVIEKDADIPSSGIYTQSEPIYESKDEVIQKVFDAYRKKQITASKFSRIMAGLYGHQGMNVPPRSTSFYPGESDAFFNMRKNWDQTAIPVNINLGKISHSDKLKANPNFARYIAETETIPSQIRKDAQKIVPKRTAPVHSPHGGGPGTGGGGSKPGSMPTGTAGRNPWGRAHGGLMDIPLPGRKRDI